MEAARKFIHIGVSNWWFILARGFDSLWWAIAGPIIFIIGNTVAVCGGIARKLGISDRERDYGLVCFPIALFLLVLAGYASILPMWACGMGALTMGYGDGLAALVGKRFGNHSVQGEKTLAGMITMGVVTMLIVTGFSIGYHLKGSRNFPWIIGVGATGAVAALLEAYSPSGFDNLSVPLGTALVAAWVFAL